MVLLKSITAVTPGKAILFGEHFVVYDYPSIIFAISKRLEITIHSNTPPSNIKDKRKKNHIKIFSNLGFNAQVIDNTLTLSKSCFSINHDIITNLNKIIQFLVNDSKDDSTNIINEDLIIYINSEIPVGGGLGSSSALCVSLTGAFNGLLNKTANKKLLCKKSIDLERIINPNTSGVDCNICTFGGLGSYTKSSGFKRLKYNISDLQFLIIDTGIIHNTYEMVNKVKKIRENDFSFFKKLCQEYEWIFEHSLKTLEKKNLDDLGKLMDKNHYLLKNLNLSNSVIDKVMAICKSHGAYGTKITGAGGGGCMLSLFNKDKRHLLDKLIRDLDEHKLSYYFINSDNYGFRLK